MLRQLHRRQRRDEDHCEQADDRRRLIDVDGLPDRARRIRYRPVFCAQIVQDERRASNSIGCDRLRVIPLRQRRGIRGPRLAEVDIQREELEEDEDREEPPPGLIQ